MRGLKPLLKRMVVALFAWFAVFVILTGVAHAGRPFVYCPAMATMQFHCCCSPTPQHAGATESAFVKAPCCCERGVLPGLPPTASAHPPSLPSAPLVAVVEPAVPLRHIPMEGAGYPRSSAHRYPIGPPPTAAASCARLRVFLL